MVRVTEVCRQGNGSLADGESQERPELFGPMKGSRQAQFVEPGEELPTTALFVVPLSESVIGWRVSLQIIAPSRWRVRASSTWGDRVFVPRPKVDQ